MDSCSENFEFGPIDRIGMYTYKQMPGLKRKAKNYSMEVSPLKLSGMAKSGDVRGVVLLPTCMLSLSCVTLVANKTQYPVSLSMSGAVLLIFD
jgi:hypothetical protein